MPTRSFRLLYFVLFVASAWGVAPTCAAQGTATPSRGQLLYDTHCAECHNLQVHWRDGRLVTDWASLKAQVRRWQGRALLEWSEVDIAEVARYLNDSVYRYVQTDRVLGRLGGATR